MWNEPASISTLWSSLKAKDCLFFPRHIPFPGNQLIWLWVALFVFSFAGDQHVQIVHLCRRAGHVALQSGMAKLAAKTCRCENKMKKKYIHIYSFHVNGEILKRFAFSGLAFIELINEVIITFEMFSTLHSNDAWMMMLMVATITFWLSSIGFSLTQNFVVYQ